MTRSTSVSRRPTSGGPLARYRDPAGVGHELVLVAGGEGRLLVDRSRSGARVVAELGEGEGRRQALAVLRDADGSTEGLSPKPRIEGYLAWAARTTEPLCRALSAGELVGCEELGRREAA